MSRQPIRVLEIIGIVCGGGVESVVMNYYRCIDRTKIQFDFVVDGYEKTILDDEINSLGGMVYHIEPYRKNIFKYMHQIYCIIKENHYRIIHSHMNTLSVFPLFSAFLAGAPVRIAHNHSTAVKEEGIRSLIKYMLRPFAPVFATHKVACSLLAGKWLWGDYAVNKDAVTIWNNAIDIKKFSYDEDTRLDVRNELGIKSQTTVLGHIGRFVFPKNHSFILQVFRAFLSKDKQAVLLLIGDGPLRQEIEAEAIKLGIKKQILFLGLRKDVSRLYNAMDIFFLPSWYEGLPVVSVEAQANGLPCILSTSVSQESRLASSTFFFPLEKGANAWAEELDRRLSLHRNLNATKEVRRAGFDIVEEGKKMTQWYLDL